MMAKTEPVGIGFLDSTGKTYNVVVVDVIVVVEGPSSNWSSSRHATLKAAFANISWFAARSAAAAIRSAFSLRCWHFWVRTASGAVELASLELSPEPSLATAPPAVVVGVVVVVVVVTMQPASANAASAASAACTAIAASSSARWIAGEIEWIKVSKFCSVHINSSDPSAQCGSWSQVLLKSTHCDPS